MHVPALVPQRWLNWGRLLFIPEVSFRRRAPQKPFFPKVFQLISKKGHGRQAAEKYRLQVYS